MKHNLPTGTKVKNHCFGEGVVVGMVTAAIYAHGKYHNKCVVQFLNKSHRLHSHTGYKNSYIFTDIAPRCDSMCCENVSHLVIVGYHDIYEQLFNIMKGQQ